MSADNWAMCPRCLRRHAKAAEKKRQEADAAYGKVRVEQWKELDREAIEATAPLETRTFREDYELGVDGEDGTFVVNYRGSCSECGLAHSFKVEQPVEGLDE